MRQSAEQWQRMKRKKKQQRGEMREQEKQRKLSVITDSLLGLWAVSLPSDCLSEIDRI